LAANARQAVARDRSPDAIQNLAPPHSVSCPQPKQPEDVLILRVHTFFKPIAPERAACRGQMGTGSAHRVRGIHDFNPLLGMFDQVTVNSSQVVDKGGAIPFASKSLETEERVGSQPNVCAIPLTDGISCHDVSPLSTCTIRRCGDSRPLPGDCKHPSLRSQNAAQIACFLDKEGSLC
jgi:hypothetical protein